MAEKTMTTNEITIQEIHRQYLLRPFSDNRPWDEIAIRTEIQALNQIANVSIYEIGRRLIFAKNNVPEGRWLKFLDECDLNRMTAALYMRVARQLVDKPRLRQLNAGIAKLDILALADPEDLEDFEKSGELLGQDGDGLMAMSREELKDLVRKGQKRMLEAKNQVKSLETEIEKLRGEDGKPDDAYYEDLHATRRKTFGDLEYLVSEALKSGDNAKVIAVYNLLHQLRLNATERMGTLEDESPLGRLLIGTNHGYDAPYLSQFSLKEIGKEEAANFSPDQEEVPENVPAK
jgi:hypothetical protein